MNMRELAAFLRRGAAFALVVALVAGATTFLATRVQPPVYRALASLVASQPAYVGSNVVAPPPVDASVYQAALLEGSIVPNALAAVRGGAVTPAQVETFKRHLTVRVDKKDLSSVIRIEVDSVDPVFAAQAANAVAHPVAPAVPDPGAQHQAGAQRRDGEGVGVAQDGGRVD
ncbi:MAG: hypothetical protein P8Y13_16345, partial [Deinococcales bacterium]